MHEGRRRLRRAARGRIEQARDIDIQRPRDSGEFLVADGDLAELHLRQRGQGHARTGGQLLQRELAGLADRTQALAHEVAPYRLDGCGSRSGAA
jgi:hypothetical protein